MGFWEEMTSLYDEFSKRHAPLERLLPVSGSSAPSPLKAQAQINLNESDTHLGK